MPRARRMHTYVILVMLDKPPHLQQADATEGKLSTYRYAQTCDALSHYRHVFRLLSR